VAAVAELHGMEFCASDNAPGLRITLTSDIGVPADKRAFERDLPQSLGKIARQEPQIENAVN
jgi:hypothetical protein